MKIAVVGLWHLGTVTAACLANHFNEVIAYDPDPHTIQNLKKGQAPLHEPQLNELILDGLKKNHLTFTHDLKLLTDCNLIWITFDTPVNDQDNAEVDFVIKQIKIILPFVSNNTLLLISSQLPVGTTRFIKDFCPDKSIHFAYSPENLRLGKAIQVFNKPERVIIGVDHEEDKINLQKLFQPFTEHLIWMSIESAEMTKHALNAFLATSVVFINELASLCEKVGANAKEVERGLKSEERIGSKAYLSPGNAIAGGTLARDVNYLIDIGKKYRFETPLFSAILHSNEAHKQWSSRSILNVFKNLNHRRITALGLTYKAGTDTLRRSGAIEICQWLKNQGAHIIGYDPALQTLPDHLSSIIDLKLTLQDALKETDAIIITTEWPEFKNIQVELLLDHMKIPYIFDANGFLSHLAHDHRLRYFSVGKLA